MRNKQQKFSSIFKYALGFFLLCCLVLAGSIFFSLQNQLGPLTNSHPGYLLGAVLAQGFTCMIVIIAWQQNLALHDIKGISLAESGALVGVNTVGKYAPGKVMGSVIRAVAVYKKTGQSQGAILASFQEQLAMLHSGLVILALLVTYRSFQLPGTLLVAFASICSLLLIRYLKPLIQKVSTLVKRPIDFDQDLDLPGETRRYAIVFSYLGVIWLSSAVTFYYCVMTFQEPMGFGFGDALVITCLAYLGGFLALFAPGGIGVRDGIIVTFLSPVTGLATAISISALHRLITIAFDMLLGLFSLLYNRRQAQD